MAQSNIEWCDAVWNPIRGCARVSPGCENCYAERQAHRFSGKGQPYEGLTVLGKHGPRWAGHARFVPEMLDAPLRWKKPKRIFVNSMSDLFHEDVADDQIVAIFDVMRQCPQHQFQILTKRPERMARITPRLRFDGDGDGRTWIADHEDSPGYRLMGGAGCSGMTWVWLGVSCEDQQRADERIPWLLQCPAAVRFVSAEPLLGPIDFARWLYSSPKPDWIIVGGES